MRYRAQPGAPPPYTRLVTSTRAEGVVIRSLTDADRTAISKWRYPGDLAIYDPGRSAFDLTEPDHVALASINGALLGYGTLGTDARVPGGRYDPGDETVDVGLGLRPDLVGAGYGTPALLALLTEAARGSGP